jgi:GH25 family lysozyme M1 (1,4-beta-N-acetylmuramidase)
MDFRFVPVANGNNIISSGFRTPARPNHDGVDFAAPLGDPIYAVEEGVVVRSGPASGFGNWIVIDHQATLGVDTVYGHMRAADLLVTEGMFVRTGQQIARVGNEGDSTGPHLHFEVWSPPGRFGGAAIDPQPLLVGAANPDAGTIDPLAGTFYGVDISNHQENFDIAETKREGFSFMAAKVTEGDFFKDSFWPRNRELMLQHFPAMFCGYHFAKNGNPIAAQVENLRAHLGDPNIPVMLDYEDPDTAGTGANMRDLVDAIDAAGMRVCAIYLPRWYWRDHMGSPPLSGLPPLWNSHYVTASGFASVIYPGKGFEGWKDYAAGAPVEILQFSDKGQVAGRLVDVNAYEGTLDGLRELFSGAPGQLSVDDCVLDFWLQLLGPGGAGWPQLNNRSVVDALAEIGVHQGIAGMMAPPAGAGPTPLPGTTVDRARDVWDQIRGPGGTGWNQLGSRSIVDAIAAIAHQLGVPGY